MNKDVLLNTDITKLSKNDIKDIYNKVYESLLNNDSSKLRKIKELLENLSKETLSYLYKYKDEIDKFYNVISILSLSTFFSYKYNENDNGIKFKGLIKNKEYNKIFNVLYENNELTNSEIGNCTNKSKQNITNMLTRLKKYGAIDSRKSLGNKKNTFYYLTYNFKNIYEKEINNDIFNNFYCCFKNIKEYNTTNFDFLVKDEYCMNDLKTK